MQKLMKNMEWKKWIIEKKIRIRINEIKKCSSWVKMVSDLENNFM